MISRVVAIGSRDMNFQSLCKKIKLIIYCVSGKHVYMNRKVRASLPQHSMVNRNVVMSLRVVVFFWQ